MSNVLGSIVDVKEICQSNLTKNIAVLVDGSQAAVHMKINVQDIGCDFYAVTGHKLYGPSGSGAVYITRDRMDEMQPFMGGGSMIGEVKRDTVTFNVAPHKFEAGTPPVAEVSGLAAAVEYVLDVGMPEIQQHELELTTYALKRLAEFKDLELYGPPVTDGRSGVLSFNLQNVHPHDVAQVLDESGIAVRAGHHCTQVLHKRFGITASVRMSFGLYNNTSEIDHFISTLDQARDIFLV